jgi:hypothetical protein
MPTLAQFVPSIEPKALVRKKDRAKRLLRFESVAALPQSLIHLRTAQVKIAKRIQADRLEPEQLFAAAGALCKIIEQRRVMLRMPGPPTGAALSRDQVLKLVRSEPLEVEQAVEPVPSAVESATPTPEIKNPAGDGGVCGG